MAELKNTKLINKFINNIVISLKAITAPRIVLDIFDSTLIPINAVKQNIINTMDNNIYDKSFYLHRHHHIVENNIAESINNHLTLNDTDSTDLQNDKEYFSGGPINLKAWAKDSVNSWNSLDHKIISKYLYVPFTAGDVRLDYEGITTYDFKLCKSLLIKQYGNRSCFDICK